MIDNSGDHNGGRIRRIVVAPQSGASSELAHNSTHSSNRGHTNRALSRGNSSKGNNLFHGSESRSGLYDQQQNAPNTARSKHHDASEISAASERDGATGCCNMKLSDLKSEAAKFAHYNAFEAKIVEERKPQRDKTPGRNIKSIRANPNAGLLFTFSKFTSSNASIGGLTMITDSIVLGGREEAENVSMLLDHGVTHVLNTAQQLPNYFPQHFVYLKLGLLDATSANIVDVSESVVNFLTHVENVGGRVLVHCLAGVSRSVSAVLMHLMIRHRLPLQDSFRYLRSCRTQVNPNDAFKLQLARLEVQELRYSSVAKDADRAWDFYEWNSIRRSMPTVRPDDDEGERYLGPEDALSRSAAAGHRSGMLGGGAGVPGGGHSPAGVEYLRQLSASSIQDAQNCCVLS